jgi:predicted permease
MQAPPVLRSLFRRPGVPLGVIGMLAVGTFALTTAFTMFDAVAFRPAPFRDSDRLALPFTTVSEPGRPVQRMRWSFPRLSALREMSTSFESLANYTPSQTNLIGDPEPEQVNGEFVSSQYFPVAGVAAARGRVFVAAEDLADAPHEIAILSHDLWIRRFAGDTGVVGRTVNVNGTPLAIVGVMPEGFKGFSGRAQLWMPTRLSPRISYADYLTTDQNFISVVGRLREGVTVETAQAELALLGARIQAALPMRDARQGTVLGATLVSLNEARVPAEVRRAGYLLLAAVALLYLLACTNATSLLLGRAAARRHDASVRRALGATPGQLAQKGLAEGATLALIGSALGLAIAWLASGAISAPTDVWGPRNFYGSLGAFADPAFDARSLAFGALLTLVTLALVGWAPATSMGSDPSRLREAGRSLASSGFSLRKPSLRGIVIGAECALAVVLVVAGGLMIDSFRRMRGTDLGVDSDRILSFMVRPSDVAVPPAQAPAFISRVLAAITSTPGVVSATVDGGAPVSGSARGSMTIVGRPETAGDAAPPVDRHYVAPAHFTTLGMKVLEGRTFTDADRAGSAKVAVISETAAHRFWPAGNAIGQRIFLSGAPAFSAPDSSAEVIGIVSDVAYEPLDRGGNRASVYTPYTQWTYGWRIYFVRTEGDPLASAGAITAAVRQVAPNLPISDLQTLSAMIGKSWARQRFDAAFYGGFGALGLLLAASGILAIVAHAVSERTREMGIRLALGSSPAGVVKMVVLEGLAIPAIGAAIGFVAAIGAARLLRASLYQIGPADPRVLAAAMIVVAAAATAACVLPALRAARVDPVRALRAD